jgi:hypothetical protein
VIQRQPTVHYAAAHLVAGRLAVDFRIPAPLFLAGTRVNSEHDAPIGDAKDCVVPFEWRGFLVASSIANRIGPHQAKPLHVRCIDLRERTKTRLAGGEAVAQPVAVRHGFRCILEQRIVDALGLSEQTQR